MISNIFFLQKHSNFFLAKALQLFFLQGIKVTMDWGIHVVYILIITICFSSLLWMSVTFQQASTAVAEKCPECPECSGEDSCPPAEQCPTCPTVVIPPGAESTKLSQQFQAPHLVSWPANTYFPHGYEASVSAAPVSETVPEPANANGAAGTSQPGYIVNQTTATSGRPNTGIVVAQ